MTDDDKFLLETNPAAEDDTPTLPAITLPPDRDEVVLLQPVLVIVLVNDLSTGSVVSIDTLGKFSTTLLLIEGVNRFQAAAGNRALVGPKSAEVLIMLDTTLPVTPFDPAAQATRKNILLSQDS